MPHAPTSTERPAPRRSAAAGRRPRLLFGALAAAALGACTILRVSDGSAVRTTYYPGVAVVQVAPGTSMQVVDVQAIGPAIVGNQASFGWLSSRMALVSSDRCQLILWRTTERAMSGLRELFGPGTELCTAEIPEGGGR